MRNYLIWAAIALSAEGVGAGEVITAAKPLEISPRMKGVIGEYKRGAETLTVLERDGYYFIREGERERPYARLKGWQREKVAAVYRIVPQRPVVAIVEEVRSLKPPVEAGRVRPVLVELTRLEPTLKLDIRYATRDNFLGTPVYTQGRAFMERTAADALVRVHRALAAQGYGLLIHDAYRPWWVTKLFWEATSTREREFVADPAKGSRHNRGSAVDLTLFDRATGQVIEMPGGYDEMSGRSYPTYRGGTSLQRWHRDLLRAAMESEDFGVNPSEWWHFDYRGWERFAIENLSFDQIEK